MRAPHLHAVCLCVCVCVCLCVCAHACVCVGVCVCVACLPVTLCTGPPTQTILLTPAASTYKGEGPMSPSDKCVGSPVLPTPLHIMYPEVTTRGPGCCFGQPSLAAITGHACGKGTSLLPRPLHVNICGKF